jgi:hypothetical protein
MEFRAARPAASQSGVIISMTTSRPPGLSDE